RKCHGRIPGRRHRSRGRFGTLAPLTEAGAPSLPATTGTGAGAHPPASSHDAVETGVAADPGSILHSYRLKHLPAACHHVSVRQGDAGLRDTTMDKAEIGLIGLGTMGSNLALNIAEKGHSIAVFNRTVSRVDEFRAGAGQLAERIVPCRDLDELAQAIRPPRPVIIMVAAGTPVDEQIAALRRKLPPHDIVIDAGNANFHDTVRRFKELEGSGLTFIGMGVSGG